MIIIYWTNAIMQLHRYCACDIYSYRSQNSEAAKQTIAVFNYKVRQQLAFHFIHCVSY